MAERSGRDLPPELVDRLRGLRVPGFRIGWITPMTTSDLVPLLFYGLLGQRAMLMQDSLGLQGYDNHAVTRALPDLERIVESLVERGCESVTVGGSVVALRLMQPGHRDRLRRLAATLRVPVNTDLGLAFESIQAAGRSCPLVVHRLAGLDAATIATGLRCYELRPAGIRSKPAVPQANLQSTPARARADLLTLCAEGLQESPDADSVLVLGGSWTAHDIAEEPALAGLPVFNNTTAFLEYAARSAAAQ